VYDSSDTVGRFGICFSVLVQADHVVFAPLRLFLFLL
jgi:hypothetical protein